MKYKLLCTNTSQKQKVNPLNGATKEGLKGKNIYDKIIWL